MATTNEQLIAAQAAFKKASDDFPSGWDIVAQQIVASLTPTLPGLPTAVAQPLLNDKQRILEDALARINASQSIFTLTSNSSGVPANSTSGDYQARLNNILAETSSLQEVLRVACPADAVTISTVLDAAFQRLSAVVAFIDGDYDARAADVDKAQRYELLGELWQCFETAVRETAGAFGRFTSIHEQTTDLKINRIEKLAQEIDVQSQQTNAKLEELRRVLDQDRNGMQQLERAMIAAQDEMNNLYARRNDAEEAARATDIAIGILTFGIWSIAGAVDNDRRASDVLGIQQDIQGLQSRINDIAGELQRVQMGILQVQQQLAQTEAEAQEQRMIKERLPGFRQRVNENIASIEGMIRSIIATKDTAHAMEVRADRLRNDADSPPGAFVKKDYAEAIIDICIDGAVDKPRLESIKQIVGALKSGYGSESLPAAIQEKITALEQKERQVLGQ